MAIITKSNRNNFITWRKINGDLSLADLQANGLPDNSPEFLAKENDTDLILKEDGISKILLERNI